MILSSVGKSDSAHAVDNTTAATQRTPDSIRSESELEARIEAAKQRLCAAPDYDEKLKHWREMVRLIDQRTPARRRFMARIAGLP